MNVEKTINFVSNTKKLLWTSLKSPKTVALIKLGIATVGLIHAIDEFISSSSGKKRIGFYNEEEE